MKTYNEIQEQIEKLEQIIVDLKNQLKLDNSVFMTNKLKHQILMFTSDIETLKWVIAPTFNKEEIFGNV